MTTHERRTRHLDWEGCFNVRDLGGLPTNDGGRTRWGAVVRADAVSGLTRDGWDALLDHGVRTVIDLRNPDELEPDAAPRPETVTTLHLPLDAIDDREFWDVWQRGPQFGTPLYYRPHLQRFPERSARVLAAIADADPGGVLFHCGGGRDRAGQISMLLLALVGVPAAEIVADYMLSVQQLPRRYAARGVADQTPLLETYLRERGTSAEKIITGILEDVDVAQSMSAAGLTDRQVRALRSRMLLPTTSLAP